MAVQMRQKERWSSLFTTTWIQGKKKSNPKRSEMCKECSPTPQLILLLAHIEIRVLWSFFGRPSSRHSSRTCTTSTYNLERGTAVPVPARMKCLAVSWLMASFRGSSSCWSFRFLAPSLFASRVSATAFITYLHLRIYLEWAQSQDLPLSPLSKNMTRPSSIPRRAKTFP